MLDENGEKCEHGIPLDEWCMDCEEHMWANIVFCAVLVVLAIIFLAVWFE